MSEKFMGDFEKKEQFPDEKEIMKIFEKISGFINGLDFKEIEKETDEKGLLKLIVETAIEGEKIEILYTREGQKDNLPFICKTYYNSDGIPFDGYSIRKLENGTWEGLDD
jgi:hypothetical protein